MTRLKLFRQAKWSKVLVEQEEATANSSSENERNRKEGWKQKCHEY